MAGETLTGYGTDDAAVFRDRWLRAAAELKNVRRRSGERLRDALARDRRDVLAAFLEPLDNLDRALDAGDDRDDAWVAGVRQVRAQMVEALGSFGVETIDPLGEAFDPHVHEAVACRPMPGCAAGTVAAVLRPGYRMDDGAVLRPARVVVAGDGEGR